MTLQKKLVITAGVAFALSAAAVLTLSLWPAALTALAGFSIGGISIASICGPSAVAQLSLTASLTWVSTFVLGIVGIAVNNMFSLLSRFIENQGNTTTQEYSDDEDSEDDLLDIDIPLTPPVNDSNFIRSPLPPKNNELQPTQSLEAQPLSPKIDNNSLLISNATLFSPSKTPLPNNPPLTKEKEEEKEKKECLTLH